METNNNNPIVTLILLGILLFSMMSLKGQETPFRDYYITDTEIREFIFLDVFPVVTQDDLLNTDVENGVKSLVYELGDYTVYHDKDIDTYYVYQYHSEMLGKTLRMDLSSNKLKKIIKNIKKDTSL